MNYSLTFDVPGPIRGKGRPRLTNRKVSDDELISAYAEHSNVWVVAERFGMCGQSVHERLTKLGIQKHINVFSDDEKTLLVAEYEDAANRCELDALAQKMGRTKAFICRQARFLGLTNRRRSKAALSSSMSERFKQWHATHDHPRGMLGKHHSDEVRKMMAIRLTKWWNGLSSSEKRAVTVKKMKAQTLRNGTSAFGSRERASWKAGWRVVGGQRCYFRSAWEANYARYLEYLKSTKEVVEWAHEPKTFWFDGLKRGCVSYLPDFCVTDWTGHIAYHEVKGWMDARSKTKIARMRKYFPKVDLVVIDAKRYRTLTKNMRFVVKEWEG